MPASTSKKHVVLPKGVHPQHVTPHHTDALHQWEGLLVILVFVHLVAFLFWGWLLYRSRDGKAKRAGVASAGQGSSGAGRNGSSGVAAAGSAPAKKLEWRTPRDILSAYNKQRLGKV